jgi:hypothetical protein
LVVLLLAVSPLPTVLGGQLTRGQVLPDLGILLAIAAIGAVGLVVAWHQPHNPVGWLLLAVTVCFLLGLNAGAYITLRYHDGHTALPLGPVALVLTPAFLAAIPLLALVIMLFPDGHLPQPGWRWFTRVCLVLCAIGPVAFEIVTVSAIAGRNVTVTANGQLGVIQHPAGSAAWLRAVAPVFFGAVLVLWVGAFARQILAFRGSAGERRQQLKWLMSGAVVFMALGVPSLGVTSSWWKVMTLGFAALPVAIGIGILKYRLYDIDRIISRTLAYAIVTGLLVGVYAGLVLLATQVLPLSGTVGVAAATLAAAALFSPLRRRVQRLVDRRFNRARYDADRTITAFAARLQDATSIEGTRADLLDVVHRALEPAHASVWLNSRSTLLAPGATCPSERRTSPARSVRARGIPAAARRQLSACGRVRQGCRGSHPARTLAV